MATWHGDRATSEGWNDSVEGNRIIWGMIYESQTLSPRISMNPKYNQGKAESIISKNFSPCNKFPNPCVGQGKEGGRGPRENIVVWGWGGSTCGVAWKRAE